MFRSQARRKRSPPLPRAVPDTHFQFGLPWGKHLDSIKALRDAMVAMMAGAQSVYCGYSPKTVEALAVEGVPIICHVGLVPPKAAWTGGFKAVGKTVEQARMICQQVQDFGSAGAFANCLDTSTQNNVT